MLNTMQIPRADGGAPWPHLYDAVADTLREAGFFVGALGLVHVDVDRADRHKPVVVSVEPSSDEEIGRLIDALAAHYLAPTTPRENAVTALRKGLRVTMGHYPPTSSPDTDELSR